MFTPQHLQTECFSLPPIHGSHTVAFERVPYDMVDGDPQEDLAQLHNVMQDKGILHQRDFLRLTLRQYYCPSYRGPAVFTCGTGFAIGSPLCETFAITQLGRTANHSEIRAWLTTSRLLSGRQSTPRLLNGPGVAKSTSSRNGEALKNDIEVNYRPVNTNRLSSRNRYPRPCKSLSSKHSTDGIDITVEHAQFHQSFHKK